MSTIPRPAPAFDVPPGPTCPPPRWYAGGVQRARDAFTDREDLALMLVDGYRFNAGHTYHQAAEHEIVCPNYTPGGRFLASVTRVERDTPLGLQVTIDATDLHFADIGPARVTGWVIYRFRRGSLVVYQPLPPEWTRSFVGGTTFTVSFATAGIATGILKPPKRREPTPLLRRWWPR